MLSATTRSPAALESSRASRALPDARGARSGALIACTSLLPPLSSEFLNIIKNSSVALTSGLLELTGRARAMQEFSFQVFEAFTAATVLYLLINIVVVIGMRLLERQVAIPGYISGK